MRLWDESTQQQRLDLHPDLVSALLCCELLKRLNGELLNFVVLLVTDYVIAEKIFRSQDFK